LTYSLSAISYQPSAIRRNLAGVDMLIAISNYYVILYST